MDDGLSLESRKVSLGQGGSDYVWPGIRDRAEDVRRKLTDPTPEHHLNVKLVEWLKRYDAWVDDKPTSGESNVVFRARLERERAVLQSEWKTCNRDAIDALKR
jgi:hypothetical protein